MIRIHDCCDSSCFCCTKSLLDIHPHWEIWVIDSLTGHREPGVITGKPLELGGSQGRGDATARGGIYTLREAANVLNKNLQGATAAIQGYGNAGSFAHLLASELLGMKIVAVSDSRGGIVNWHGLEYDAVMAHKKRSGSVIDFPGAENI
ncbi:MAG: hypothetical protein M9918_20390, partial [Anaerolineae bacterium]|nr:hypothetical protein [Anaerolineae bacterium]